MSTTLTPGHPARDPQGPQVTEVPSDRRWWRVEGLAADLSVIALSLALATILLVGSFTMTIRGQQVPGPTHPAAHRSAVARRYTTTRHTGIPPSCAVV